LGFVGRVTPEKGVRLLQKIEQALLESGLKDFRIIVVGDGSEVGWLKQRLAHGEFLGVLRGDELARAYANMDVFVFPSRTDTFGNVVQEAAASGVAAVVTNEGGPRNLVVHGETGYIAEKDPEFVRRVVELAHNRELLKKWGSAARERMAGITWDGAFEKTYAAYRHCLPAERRSECLGEKVKAAAQTRAGLRR
jgi:glycosyltransferase involved in cell wall biosynthesis